MCHVRNRPRLLADDQCRKFQLYTQYFVFEIDYKSISYLYLIHCQKVSQYLNGRESLSVCVVDSNQQSAAHISSSSTVVSCAYVQCLKTESFCGSQCYSGPKVSIFLSRCTCTRPTCSVCTPRPFDSNN